MQVEITHYLAHAPRRMVPVRDAGRLSALSFIVPPPARLADRIVNGPLPYDGKRALPANTYLIFGDEAILVLESNRFGRIAVLLDEAMVEFARRSHWGFGVMDVTPSGRAFGYVRRGTRRMEGTRRWVTLHRELVEHGVGRAAVVDHRNHEPCDCRLSNLMAGTSLDNRRNRRAELVLQVRPPRPWETRALRVLAAPDVLPLLAPVAA